MRVGGGVGASKKLPGFMGQQIRDDFPAGMKFVGDPLKRMGSHDGSHHFAVHGKGNINFVSLDNGRPVLVPQCMSQFKAGLQDIMLIFCQQAIQMNYQNILQLYLGEHHQLCLLIQKKNVSIPEVGVAFQSNCNLDPAL